MCEIQSNIIDVDYNRVSIAEKKVKKKAIGVVTIYTVSDILFALYPKVLDTELVTFT